MKEKTKKKKKCLEDRRRGAKEVVCWSLEEGEEELGCCSGNFCKKPKTKNKLGLGTWKDKWELDK